MAEPVGLTISEYKVGAFLEQVMRDNGKPKSRRCVKISEDKIYVVEPGQAQFHSITGQDSRSSFKFITQYPLDDDADEKDGVMQAKLMAHYWTHASVPSPAKPRYSWISAGDEYEGIQEISKQEFFSTPMKSFPMISKDQDVYLANQHTIKRGAVIMAIRGIWDAHHTPGKMKFTERHGLTKLKQSTGRVNVAFKPVFCRVCEGWCAYSMFVEAVKDIHYEDVIRFPELRTEFPIDSKELDVVDMEDGTAVVEYNGKEFTCEPSQEQTPDNFVDKNGKKLADAVGTEARPRKSNKRARPE